MELRQCLLIAFFFSLWGEESFRLLLIFSVALDVSATIRLPFRFFSQTLIVGSTPPNYQYTQH